MRHREYVPPMADKLLQFVDQVIEDLLPMKAAGVPASELVSRARGRLAFGLTGYMADVPQLTALVAAELDVA
jgi:hypothetical protein